MKSQKRIEYLVYILIWFIVFTIPIFSDNNLYGKDWNFIFSEWIRYIPLLLVFTINDVLLSKKLLLKEKYWQYIISIILLLITSAFLFELTRVINFNMDDSANSIVQTPDHFPPPPEGPMRSSYLRNILESMILSILVIGFNDAIKMVFRFHKIELERQESKKIHLETQLSFLRTQISPHFFMNTLNNIHALVDLDPERAQESIIKLSNLMRYLLKQSEDGHNTISEEFNFLVSYIDLMKLRYSEKVKVTTNFVMQDPKINIPSLLFVSVVENAFKYGVSYAKKSFINISALQDQNSITFTVENSKINNTEINPSKSSLTKTKTGVGLNNLKKQLDLLFPQKHLLKIDDNDELYKVTIQIPIEP